MRRGGAKIFSLAVALAAVGIPSTARAHHPSSSHWWWWSNGQFVAGSGYPQAGWGAYSPSLTVAGLPVYGPMAGGNFAGPGIGGVGFGGGGNPLANGPIVGGPGGGAGGGAAGGNGGGGNGAGGNAGGGNGAGKNPAPQPVVVVPDGSSTRGKPRVTNTESKTRAGKFMQYGDTLFVKQKYNSALERYREAQTTAPDLAEPYFRQVFALVAAGQYDSAKKSLDRGLRVKLAWPDTNFELSTLYGPTGHLAKSSHREALASAIEQNPQAADLLVLMGVLLFCDGEHDRAQLFFDRAVELGANAEHLLDRFLAPRPAGAVAM